MRRIFLLVLAAGAYNFRGVLPALGTDDATRHLRRSAGLELSIGAVVLLVTAVLVATARSYEEADPHAPGATSAAELPPETRAPVTMTGGSEP
jgi:hypothetical protein